MSQADSATFVKPTRFGENFTNCGQNQSDQNYLESVQNSLESVQNPFLTWLKPSKRS